MNFFEILSLYAQLSPRLGFFLFKNSKQIALNRS